MDSSVVMERRHVANSASISNSFSTSDMRTELGSSRHDYHPHLPTTKTACKEEGRRSVQERRPTQAQDETAEDGKQTTSRQNAERVVSVEDRVPSSRDGASCAVSFARVRDELLDAPWYWGDVTPLEAADILDSMPDDTFLVRDSTDQRSLFAITYKTTGGAIGSSRINFRRGLFSLNCTKTSPFSSFGSLVTLIDDCVQKSQTQPVCMVKISGQAYSVRLRYPLVRHEPRTLQEACRRCIRQHCPRARLEDRANGLPYRMRQYLLACPFRPTTGSKIGPHYPVAETAL